MGSGSEQTQKVRLSKPMRKEAKWALKGGRAAFEDMLAAESPSQYVGLDPRQTEALQMQEELARSGGVSQPWMDEYNKVLSGGYLDAESNPYLQDIVNRSVLSAQVGLADPFAKAGRVGGGTMANAIQDTGQEVASRIFGQNYFNERGRMADALRMGGMAQQMQMAPSMMLSSVGQQYQADAVKRMMEDVRRYEEPLAQWDQYQSYLQNNPMINESTTTTGSSTDWAATLAPIAGSAIGTMFGPVGTAIGGQLGKMAGGLFGDGGGGGPSMFDAFAGAGLT